MKQFIGAAALVTMAAAQSSACLFCRKEDKDAGFLTSFSYCEHFDACLQDEWNYISRDCQSGWVRGSQYEIGKCKPEEITCPSFVSSTEWFQRYKN